MNEQYIPKKRHISLYKTLVWIAGRDHAIWDYKLPLPINRINIKIVVEDLTY